MSVKHKLISGNIISRNPISNILIVLGLGLTLLFAFPYLRDEARYYLMTLTGKRYELGSGADKESVFARYLGSKPLIIEPVNKDFALVIEKIGVNAPVVVDVSVTNESAYKEALKYGVAHSASSMYPSDQAGNVYIFAHSSLNFWELGKYAQTFNLLHKLAVGDTIHVFYENRDYVYKVVNKEIYSGFNTYPLTRPVVEPLLTLQTCDPPGTTFNRLVVTAKLQEVL